MQFHSGVRVPLACSCSLHYTLHQPAVPGVISKKHNKAYQTTTRPNLWPWVEQNKHTSPMSEKNEEECHCFQTQVIAT